MAGGLRSTKPFASYSSPSTPRHLQEMLEQIGQPMLVFSENGLVKAANPMFSAITGRSREDIEGMLLEDLIQGPLPGFLRDTGQGGQPPPVTPFVLPFLGGDGSPTLCAGHYCRFPSPESELFCLVLKNPTNRPAHPLHHRIEMEKAVCRISSELLRAEPETFETRILNALGVLGTFVGVEQADINLFSEDGSYITKTFRWAGSGASPRRARITGLHLANFSWSMEAFRRGDPILVPSLKEIPPEGAPERELWESVGLKSMVLLPLIAEDILLGTLGFDSPLIEKQWTEEDLALLRLTAELFALAISRNRHQDEAARSNTRYRTLARHFPNGMVFLFDRQLRFLLADGQDMDRMGHAREDFPGRNLRDTLPPATCDILEPLYQRALLGEAQAAEVPFQDEIYEVHVLPLRGSREEIVGGMAVSQCITARKKTEENLRHATHLLLTLIEHLSSGILVEDEHHTVQFLNRRFTEMFPTPNRLERLPFSSLPREPKSEHDEPHFLESLRPVFSSAGLPGTGEFSLPDGRILERDRIPLVAEGELSGNLWEFRDVTASRAVERQAREAHEQEIRIAGEIHRALLVGRPPASPTGPEIGVLSRPSQLVDGDLVDFFPDNDHSLDVLVGDVMGKGIPAALIAAATRLAFLRARNRLASVRDGSPAHPETILGFVHMEIAAHLVSLTSFVTVAFARLNLQHQRLFIVNCGHPPVLLFRHGDGEVENFHSQNAPIGIGERPYYRGISSPYAPGDLMVFLSDGVTEARRPNGEMFGMNRVIEVIRSFGQQSPSAVVEGLSRAIDDFLGGEPLQDDCTCVIIRLPTKTADLPGPGDGSGPNPRDKA